MDGIFYSMWPVFMNRGDDDFYNELPEEVQEALDEHTGKFHSEREMRRFAEDQLLRS